MRVLLLTLATLAAATPALAGDDFYPPVRDPLVIKECGQCHMTFQPGLLPAQSWEKMMSNLSNHYGEDASLSPEKTAAIRAVLVAGAGRPRHGEIPERITDSRRFLKKHHFPDQVWQRPNVMAKSNCPACHKGAEQGWYEDD